VWKGKNTHNVLVWKPEAKRSLGRPRHRKEDDIKIDIKLGWEDVERINLAVSIG
jgi:hypothetical protein